MIFFDSDPIANLSLNVLMWWAGVGLSYMVLMWIAVMLDNAICATFGWRPHVERLLFKSFDRFDLPPMCVVGFWFIAIPFQVLWAVIGLVQMAHKPRSVKNERPYQGCV
ncbi:hypothetical protein HOU02_gp219 [Caulobacter phage CcrBL9]|uniref:Transmembrane protein n=1 Tax=Caulobacter phage CcrBL9 TaxID=2283270 RepID=A0A385ECU8_9CAUD|nr:hypothetical protein HOU02_gp219 [Caulobacter phage CcrBL9]AXQ69506.1 hypothetical protein CcrBL9_gp482 [Caulobacter phage CcrBL9]